MTQNKLSFAIVFSIISASIISSQAMDQPVPPKINPSPFQGGLFDTIPPELIKEIEKYKQEISLYTDEEIIELTKSNYFSVPPLINERFKKIESVDIISIVL